MIYIYFMNIITIMLGSMSLGISETIAVSLLVYGKLFVVFSIFCITSFGDYTRVSLQHQETKLWRLRKVLLAELLDSAFE